MRLDHLEECYGRMSTSCSAWRARSLHRGATAENVTDFLTKYITGSKAEQSVAYLTNKINEVPVTEA